MCKCGCNTCETKGPLLTEGKVKSLLSENLSYHIDNNISLMENVFRIGSDAHLSMIKEARKLYSRGVLDLCEEDEGLMKTHLGEFDLYKNQIIPLDLPMIREATEYKGRKLSHEEEDRLDLIAHKEFDCDFKDCSDENKSKIWNKRDLVGVNENKAIITFKNDYEVKMNTGEGYDDDFESFEAGEREQVYILDKNDKRVHVEFGDGTNAYIPTSLISLNEQMDIYDEIANMEFGMDYDQLGDNEKEWVRDEIDNMEMRESLNEDEQLDEKKKAKKKKKDPPIGKPKRGGSKAYYVYVRDPKTKRIKKVSFGSGGLRAKIRNPKARKAFAARHKCSQKTDRTKPSYWSCRLPRYASQLGLGANMNTFW